MYQREIEIQALIGQGHGMSYICDILAEKYELSPRTIQDQYYNVVRKLGDLVTEGRHELKCTLTARNDYIYRKAIEDGNLKVALDSNAAQAKLSGLFKDSEVTKDEKTAIKLVKQDFSKPTVVPDKASNDKE